MATDVCVKPPGLMTIPSVPLVLASCILSTSAPSQLLQADISAPDSVEVRAYYNEPLEEFDDGVEVFSLLDTCGLDVLQRLVSVEMGLARSQEVQVRAIDDQHGFLPVTHLSVFGLRRRRSSPQDVVNHEADSRSRR